MRRRFSRDRFCFESASPRWQRWGCVLLLALVTATGCAAIRPDPQPIDLSPLMAVRPDPAIGLSFAFPDYQALVTDGVQQRNGEARRDGVVDFVTKTFDSELDELHSWTVDVRVIRFDTPEGAARDLDSSCHSFSRGGAAGEPVRWQDGAYCFSSIGHRHTDPQNLYLPADLYSSWVFVRRDQIVVRLYERHLGSEKSARNRIILEVAERLSRLTPSASAN
jgi:hypothetical protein